MSREVAFAEHYRTHYRRVFGLCRQLLGSAAAAEDAAQETFVRAHRAYGKYDESKPFAGWILSIATNHCVDLVRRRVKEADIFGSETAERLEAQTDAGDALDELLTSERARELKAAVAELPERYRVPLVLAYYGDASYDDVAATLGITRTHVGVLICRAKHALRRKLSRSEERR